MSKEVRDLKKRRGLKCELNSLPVLNFCTTTYDNIKTRNVVFETSFNVLERGCSSLGGRILRFVGKPDELESMALDYVNYMTDNYPIIRKTPRGIYRKTKSRFVDWGLKKTQVVLQTMPGKVAVWGVGAASSICDKMLSTVQYLTNIQPKDPKAINKERLGSYTSNVVKSPDKKTRRNSIGESTASIVEYTVVFPIEVTTRFLQTIHLWFHILLADAEEKTKQNGMSPEKAAAIKNRRKVSPRKRSQRSSITSWSRTAIHFLRLDSILPFFRSKSFLKDINPSLAKSSPNKSDAEHKRKYDDILSDDSSSQDEPSYMDHLRKLDLSQYLSDEDPDYEPGMESSDSDEYVDDETETDEDPSIIGGTPDPLPPRNKGKTAVAPSNTPSKSQPADKNTKQKETSKDTPKKSILKSTNQVKEVKPEDSKDYVQLSFKASRLDSKDIIGKSDPYLTLMKQGQDGKWLVLHKTEMILNSSEPTWKPFSIPLLSLWNGDKTKQIKIMVYDKDDTLSDDLVGEAVVTLEEILQAFKQEVTWNIVNQKKQSKKKNYINSGQVHLTACKGILEDLKGK